MVSLFQKMRIEAGLDLLHFALVRVSLSRVLHHMVKNEKFKNRNRKFEGPFSDHCGFFADISFSIGGFLPTQPRDSPCGHGLSLMLGLGKAGGDPRSKRLLGSWTP